MPIKGLAYTKTSWVFGERPVASAKFNLLDDRIEAALELVLMMLTQTWGNREGVIRGATDDDLAVQATPTPSLSVAVQPGYALVGGFPFRILSPIETVDVIPPTTNPRIDLVQASIHGWSALVKTGAEAATPVAPAPDADCIALAELHLRPGMGSIKNADDGTHGYIVDVRSFV